MKYLLMLCCCFAANNLTAQELFTYSEPASNMPVKSYALRSNNYLMRQNASGKYSYVADPEMMIGISKKLMLHAEGFFGNDYNRFAFDGASIYGKYRFYSRDEVHAHFRMAAYGKLAFSKMAVDQPAIDLTGRNSGAELGMVATKLIYKVALSAGGSLVNAFDNARGNKFVYSPASKRAVSYNLSVGKLFLPKEYTGYGQTNFNGMLELLGQTNLASGHSFIDLAPSLQLIFLSKIRLDAGYRFPMVRSLARTADRGFLLRLEYNFFNAF